MGEARGADLVLFLAGQAAVTFTSAVSAYRAAAAGDVGSTAFVGASYATVLLLFHRLRAYECLLSPGAAGDDGRRRRRAKREVWTLCTLQLTVLFSWKMAAAMPSWPVALAVWAMAALTTVGGFVAMFHRRHQ
ncbi:hypothetical protein U9M48_029834 [Paspalum notatum var. saurae]|uniref:Uncharacterized protein n=1 Tax=Paspalum notatum var. saurae TaxID=547442 RepID=A0AAQ3TZN2_PASNO